MSEASNPAIFSSCLLLEDDHAHAMLVTRGVKELVTRIHHVKSVREAVAALQKENFEVIITDLKLPDSPEGRPVQHLAGLAKGTPIVVLTSSTSLEDAVAAMKEGASDYIVKNFDSNFREILSFTLSRVKREIETQKERSRIQREMEILRVSIENSQDGLALVSRNGEIRYRNRAFSIFQEHCGAVDLDILKSFSDRVEKSDALVTNIKNNLGTLKNGAVWNTEINISGAKEGFFDLTLSALPVAGDQVCAVWVRDRSAQRIREKFQREMLSTTTHDIKGPLGAIILSSEMLLDSLTEPSRERELSLRISSSAHGAINLIDEMLSARRIQEGTFVIHPSELNIYELVQEASSDFKTMASARGILLEIGDSGSELVANVDKLGVIRVIANLLSNALKFTPKGGVVRISLQGDASWVHISVEDTGAGMEPHEITSLFERFTRLDKHAQVSGTGLGLFVVKSIVVAHGGRVEVTSQVGVGSRFDVILPRQPLATK